jgi:hypothetical protein
MTTVNPQLPLRFGRVRVTGAVEAGSPDLTDPAVVESLLSDARRVAREESARRPRLAFFRR